MEENYRMDNIKVDCIIDSFKSIWENKKRKYIFQRGSNMDKTAENRDINRGKKIILITGIVFAALLAAGIFCPMVYYLNDDVAMRSILSGRYTGTPDGHAVYMKYPLTGFISLLYKIAGNVPWFELVMGGCFLLSVTAVLCRGREMVYQIHKMAGEATEKDKKKGKQLGLFCALGAAVLLFYLPHYIAMHYTIVAAVVGSTALFLVVTAQYSVLQGRLVHLEKSLLPVGLLVLCYCIRSQVFFLLLPFWGGALLWQMSRGKWRVKFPGIYQQMVCVFVCIALCSVWNEAMYSSKEWQDYKIYNEKRTSLYDYAGFLPFEENRELYETAGIGQEEYWILEHYNIALDSSIDADLMSRAAEIYQKEAGEGISMRQKLKGSLKEYYYQMRYSQAPFIYLILGGYLGIFLIVIKRKKWLQALLLSCLGAGRSLIWVYLIYQGRFPERISTSLYLLEGMLLAGILLGELVAFQGNDPGTGKSTEGKWLEVIRRKTSPVIIVMVCVLLLAAGFSRFQKAYLESADRQQTQLAYKALQEYCGRNTESQYLLDVYSMVGFGGEQYELLPDTENYMLLGGWLTSSPLMAQRFAWMGSSTGIPFSVEGENVYFVTKSGKDMSWMGQYMDKRLKDSELIQTDTVYMGEIGVFDIYRLLPLSQK